MTLPLVFDPDGRPPIELVGLSRERSTTDAPTGSTYTGTGGGDVTRAHHAVLGADAALGVTVDPWPATAGAPVALDPFSDALYDLTFCTTFYGHGVVLAPAAAGRALAWRYRLPAEDPSVAANWKPLGVDAAGTPVDALAYVDVAGYAIGPGVRLAAAARTRVVVRVFALPAAASAAVLKLGNLYGTARDGPAPPNPAPYATPAPGSGGRPGGGTPGGGDAPGSDPGGGDTGGGGTTGTPATRFYMFPSASPSLPAADPWTAPIDGFGTGHNFASGQRITAYEAGVEHAYTTPSFQLVSAPLAAQTIVGGAWQWWLAGAVDVDGATVQVRAAHLRLVLVRSGAEVAVVSDSAETAEVGSAFGYPQSNFVGSAGAMAGATVTVEAGDRLRWEVFSRGHYLGPLSGAGDGGAEYNINVAYARNPEFGAQLGLQPPGAIFLQ